MEFPDQLPRDGAKSKGSGHDRGDLGLLIAISDLAIAGGCNQEGACGSGSSVRKAVSLANSPTPKAVRSGWEDIRKRRSQRDKAFSRETENITSFTTGLRKGKK